VPKSLLDCGIYIYSTEEYIECLSTSTKKNVGDSFKHIVTDNFVCHLGFSINLRSLKNLIKLRLSGSAWFQFRELSRKILEELPPEMKSLILKENN
jgi:thymidylate synthase (FAD)